MRHFFWLLYLNLCTSQLHSSLVVHYWHVVNKWIEGQKPEWPWSLWPQKICKQFWSQMRPFIAYFFMVDWRRLLKLILRGPCIIQSRLTLNNEDKSGKDPKRFPQHGKASLLCTNSLDYIFLKNEFQGGFENFPKSNFHTLSQSDFFQ